MTVRINIHELIFEILGGWFEAKLDIDQTYQSNKGCLVCNFKVINVIKASLLLF